MTGFTGRSFNFFGDVGKTYSLISSMNHQVGLLAISLLPLGTIACTSAAALSRRELSVNLLEQQHMTTYMHPCLPQLSARLKLAQMWNHNGTNMDGIGFMYKSYRVLMELQGDIPHGALLNGLLLLLPCCLLPCRKNEKTLASWTGPARCRDACSSGCMLSAVYRLHRHAQSCLRPPGSVTCSKKKSTTDSAHTELQSTSTTRS